MHALKKLAQGIESLVDWTGRAAAWLTLGLVVLIAIEVTLRYAASIGSVATQELEWHLLALISLLGIAYTQKEDAHVRVDVFYQYYSARTKDWMEFISAAFVMAPFAFYIAWLSVRFVTQSYDMGEISPDPGGLTQRWMLKAFVGIGFALLGLHSVALAIRHGLALVTREERHV